MVESQDLRMKPKWEQSTKDETKGESSSNNVVSRISDFH
jgi:hypothetical protein